MKKEDSENEKDVLLPAVANQTQIYHSFSGNDIQLKEAGSESEKSSAHSLHGVSSIQVSSIWIFYQWFCESLFLMNQSSLPKYLHLRENLFSEKLFVLINFLSIINSIPQHFSLIRFLLTL